MRATLLVLSVPRGHALPADAGYTTAALASPAILAAALAVSLLFAWPAGSLGRLIGERMQEPPAGGSQS